MISCVLRSILVALCGLYGETAFLHAFGMGYELIYLKLFLLLVKLAIPGGTVAKNGAPLPLRGGPIVNLSLLALFLAKVEGKTP